MCGIVGYVGNKKASLIVLEALKNVEYRGYDSAGIAVLDKEIRVIKDTGKLAEIEKKHDFSSLVGGIGIGHTRWATHGEVNSMNAHPHTDESGEICLVHNGIIENFQELRWQLLKQGCKLRSDTDTELMAHLIASEFKKTSNFRQAFLSALKKVDGSFSFVVMHKGEEKLYAARRSSPLLIGVGKGEMFFASDMPAVLSHTRDFVFLQENEVAEITAKGYGICKLDGTPVFRAATHVDWTPQMAQKEGYPHFMIKEIREQGASIRNSLATDISDAKKLLAGAKQISIIACGTSYHSALVFKGLLARAGIRSEAIIGSEYGAAIFGKGTVALAISQSGETADTLVAVRHAQSKGAKIIGVTNVVGSSLSREADACVYIGAGPEISVVATKSFTSQLIVLYRLAFALAKDDEKISRNFFSDCKLSNLQYDKKTEKLRDLSALIDAVLSKEADIKNLAKELCRKKDFFFIGRGLSFPIAAEGALKLKEITYLHAEAYAAGELKHGPLSLLENGVCVLAVAPTDETTQKMVSNMHECKARNATLIGISDSQSVLSECDFSFRMPACDALFAPILYIIPLQLLAYHMTVILKRDPDKPRNLAKSVTVE